MAATDFSIAGLTVFHVAFSDEPSYWEDYRRGVAAAGGARFEFRDGWRTVYPRLVESVIVQVQLADGASGWGEANCPIGPEVAALVAESLVLPMARCREFGHPSELWDFLYDAQRGRGYAAGYWLDAMAAVDIALYDAIGRREGVPVAALLCEEPRAQIPVYLSGLRRASPDDRLEHLRAWLDTGLRGVKLFFDGDLDAGTAELEFLQAGAEVEQWMVDTLWMVAPERAAEARGRYGDLGCRWLECPLEPEDLAGHRELLRHPGAPIALGEHFRTHWQTQAWFNPARPGGLSARRGPHRPQRRPCASGTRRPPPVCPRRRTWAAASAPSRPPPCTSPPPARRPACRSSRPALAERAALVGATAWEYADGGFRLPDTPRPRRRDGRGRPGPLRRRLTPAGAAPAGGPRIRRRPLLRYAGADPATLRSPPSPAAAMTTGRRWVQAIFGEILADAGSYRLRPGRGLLETRVRAHPPESATWGGVLSSAILPPMPDLDRALLLDLYRTLCTIRRFEESCIQLYRQGGIRGYLHPYLGEEAIAGGVCAALGPDDYIVSTHRGHGHCLARGGRLDRMFAEITGKATGYCGGLGGSMHIADVEAGNLGGQRHRRRRHPHRRGRRPRGHHPRREPPVRRVLLRRGRLPRGPSARP